jgi:hypothetical protein
MQRRGSCHPSGRLTARGGLFDRFNPGKRHRRLSLVPQVDVVPARAGAGNPMNLAAIGDLRSQGDDSRCNLGSSPQVVIRRSMAVH